MIDVQKGFEDAGFWGRRDKPAAEANIATLIRTGVTRTAPSSSPDGEVVTAEELTRATAASLHHGASPASYARRT